MSASIYATDAASPLLGTAPPPPGTSTYHRARVLRVVDGDTVVADVDLGMGISSQEERIRMRGYDAPELGQVGGPQARAALAAFLPVGVAVTLEVGADWADKYGRLLAVVWLPDGRSVNRVMFQEGHHK